LTSVRYNEEKLRNVTIRLQEFQSSKGFTDFELYLPGEFVIVIEAKKGWILPSVNQLTKYSERKEFSEDTQIKVIVSLSECEDYYAKYYLPAKICGVPIKHIPYAKIARFVSLAYTKTKSFRERQLLQNLDTYLKKLMRMQQLDSNWVFVVSLGSGTPENWSISWIDIVKKKNRYFHPLGNRWPQRPPNYIAFRYHGALQSIHFIPGYTVTNRLSDYFIEAPKNMQEHEPYFIYTLGPAIIPPKQTLLGKRIVRSGRVWCMLDTLLTCNTISDALSETERRYKIMNTEN